MLPSVEVGSEINAAISPLQHFYLVWALKRRLVMVMVEVCVQLCFLQKRYCVVVIFWVFGHT